MILPGTHTAILLLTLCYFLCWGVWTSLYKATGKWRFELFHVDFSIGALIAVVVAAATFGTFSGSYMNNNELMLTVWDNLSTARKLNLFLAFVGGGLLNLGTLLMLAAISLGGLAVAVPIAMGVGMVVGLLLHYGLTPTASGTPLFAAAGCALAAACVATLAYRWRTADRLSEQDAEAAAQLSAARTPSRYGVKKKSGLGILRGVLTAAGGGLLIGSYYSLVNFSRQTEVGLGPYTAALLVGIGVFVSTPFLVLVMMNLPIHGEPLGPSAFFQSSIRDHLLGVLAGFVWGAGLVAYLVALTAPREIDFARSAIHGAGYVSAVLAALLGLFAWKEFTGARGRSTGALAASLLLFVAAFAIYAFRG